MTRFRTIMAFLIAPLIIPVGLSVAALVSPGDSPVSLTDFLGLIVLFSLYALPVSCCSDFLLGCFFVATESVPGPRSPSAVLLWG